LDAVKIGDRAETGEKRTLTRSLTAICLSWLAEGLEEEVDEEKRAERGVKKRAEAALYMRDMGCKTMMGRHVTRGI